MSKNARNALPTNLAALLMCRCSHLIGRRTDLVSSQTSAEAEGDHACVSVCGWVGGFVSMAAQPAVSLAAHSVPPPCPMNSRRNRLAKEVGKPFVIIRAAVRRYYVSVSAAHKHTIFGRAHPSRTGELPRGADTVLSTYVPSIDPHRIPLSLYPFPQTQILSSTVQLPELGWSGPKWMRSFTSNYGTLKKVGAATRDHTVRCSGT